MKEEEERKLTAQQKQEKELQKKAIRKERKEIRAICKVKKFSKEMIMFFIGKRLFWKFWRRKN